MSLLDFENLEIKNIYTDLLRKLVANGHNVYIISPVEKRNGVKSTVFIRKEGYCILKPIIGNIQKANYIEKGISTLTLERILIKSIQKNFSAISFDLILYTTPPITFEKVIKYLKNINQAVTYLLLKDIFPQNAVDLGALSKKGVKGIIYNFFRKKEKRLYRISDYIGCMSEANRAYIITHNNELDNSKVEICPNSLEPENINLTSEEKKQIRSYYKIPLDKKVIIYGGNLGKPQGIDFLLTCISQCENTDVYFVIVGSGTEFERVEKFGRDKANLSVLHMLPPTEYLKLAKSSDAGLLLLDRRFLIPNFPSRVLSYMQVGIPVLAATDVHTDIGKIICEGKFGYWCEHGDIKAFLENIDKICFEESYATMCNNSRNFFLSHYTSEISYNIIMSHFTNGE